MEQLILHLIGDYLFQNNWMGLNKKDNSLACFVHVLLYSLPFLIIGSLNAVLIILVTHFIIDRTNIVMRIMAFKNRVGLDNFGCSKDTPFALSIWLLIIADNTFDLSINYLCLKYL